MKILLLSNPMPHYHRIENTLPALQKALDGIALHHSQNLDDLNHDNLNQYNGVLIYCSGQNLADEPWQALEQWVAQGGALIGIHNATDTWKNQPGYIALIGGKFITHPPQLSLQIEIADDAHPITKGLEPFETWDELYIMETDAANYHLLLQTRSYKDEILPVAWCKEHGSGRVFYTALGHEPVERAAGGPLNTHFQTLLRRGALWAMKQPQE